MLTNQLDQSEVNQGSLQLIRIRKAHTEHLLGTSSLLKVKLGVRTIGSTMALDLNDPELEFSDLVYAYQSWVMAVINDEKLEGEDKLLTDDITEDALNSMRFLPGEVTSAIETSLARVYDVDPDELAELLFPED
jgi:hypothetical protein